MASRPFGRGWLQSGGRRTLPPGARRKGTLARLEREKAQVLEHQLLPRVMRELVLIGAAVAKRRVENPCWSALENGEKRYEIAQIMARLNDQAQRRTHVILLFEARAAK